MADRLTQMQDGLNAMAELFCNSVGVLHQHAQRSCGASQPQPQPQQQQQQQDEATVEENMQLFAGLIRKRHEELNKIIRLLPSAEARAAHQGEALSAAQQSNKEAAAALAAEVQRGQELLARVREATQIVGRARFNLDKELKEEEKEEDKKGKGGGGRAAAAAPNDKKRAASDEGDEGDGGDAGGDDSAAGRKRRRVHSSAPSADGDK